MVTGESPRASGLKGLARRPTWRLKRPLKSVCPAASAALAGANAVDWAEWRDAGGVLETDEIAVAWADLRLSGERQLDLDKASSGRRRRFTVTGLPALIDRWAAAGHVWRTRGLARLAVGALAAAPTARSPCRLACKPVRCDRSLRGRRSAGAGLVDGVSRRRRHLWVVAARPVWPQSRRGGFRGCG